MKDARGSFVAIFFGGNYGSGSWGKYINPPEKIQAIKEKYKNGVSFETIKQMME